MSASTEPCDNPFLKIRSLLKVVVQRTRALLTSRKLLIHRFMHFGLPSLSSFMTRTFFHTLSYAVLKSSKARTDHFSCLPSSPSYTSGVILANCSSVLLPLRNPAGHGASIFPASSTWYSRVATTRCTSLATQLVSATGL